MKMSLREIKKAYDLLKGYARKSLDAGRFEEAQGYIHNCVILASQFNWIYTDAELNAIEREIGEALVTKRVEDYCADEERVVFFDDHCVTFILAIQYLEALVKAGKKVRFVTCRPYHKKDNGIIFSNYITKIKGLEIVLIDEPDFGLRKQKIYDTIVGFKPSKLLLHIETDSVVLPVLYTLPKQITKYLINLQDQTFWLGKDAFDYSIEFRPFGASISLERRGLKKEQLLMLPFYPVYDKNPFEGFPKEADGHVTIFSGGDLYKTLDTQGAYWRLIKRILDAHPDVRFLFATKNNPFGRKVIDDFVTSNHFEDRFFYIGFRKDIYEVLRHCDIYMGTSPTSGSLMSQLAAINAKPILQYYYPGTPDDETEQALCINESFPISFQNEDAFMQEADKLINDAKYRKAQGERIQKAMIQPEQFDKALIQLLETNKSPFPVEIRDVNHRLIEERWYELEKHGFTSNWSYVCSRIDRKDILRHIPTLYFKKQIETIKNLWEK